MGDTLISSPSSSALRFLDDEAMLENGDTRGGEELASQV